MPRLLQLFYDITWELPNVFSAFWLPREFDIINMCDLLSKFQKSPNVKITNNTVIINISDKVTHFKRIRFPFDYVMSLAKKYIHEWKLFKESFPDITNPMKRSKINGIICIVSLFFSVRVV